MRRTKTRLTIRVANRPGVAGEVASALWAARVDIQALEVAVKKRRAIIHLAVNKPAVAKRVLAENGWKVSER